ncbi:Lrp/AsnC family transcriptional regulator [Eudoraea chungangensis]|uniref:Lrp/AsnC family transcriptional regulator n=1 Tax=Eudoraea chungangensis TaxID=1481905 RepID=UPI0023EC573F|nr:Lrp/AsnC family transcriptional regulator [Eudoraea chungangensis]
MDAKDRALVGLLQENCKWTTKQYANELGLSVTAVYERIRRLERTGIIRKYVALVDPRKIDKAFAVMCHVRLIQHTKENVMQFEKEVLKLKEVSECYHLSGDYDYLLKVNVSDMEAYREFMVTKLTTIKNIGSTQSAFVINEVKHTTAVSI